MRRRNRGLSARATHPGRPVALVATSGKEVASCLRVALLTHTVEAVLVDLADSGATGCLLVRDQEGDEAEVYLRDGEVYAVIVPGRRAMLGVRLMSRGALTPEALAEALEIQRTELQGWRLGELLVHLGLRRARRRRGVRGRAPQGRADRPAGWPVAAWKFRKNKKTRQDVAPPTPVADLFDDLRHRATTWETILDATGGPDAVPTLAASSPSDDVALGPNEWALLCKVDGTRSVAELAAECGFTLFEAGQVVMRLVDAGLVAVQRQPVEVAEVEPADDGGVELVLRRRRASRARGPRGWWRRHWRPRRRNAPSRRSAPPGGSDARSAPSRQSAPSASGPRPRRWSAPRPTRPRSAPRPPPRRPARPSSAPSKRSGTAPRRWPGPPRRSASAPRPRPARRRSGPSRSSASGPSRSSASGPSRRSASAEPRGAGARRAGGSGSPRGAGARRAGGARARRDRGPRARGAPGRRGRQAAGRGRDPAP